MMKYIFNSIAIFVGCIAVIGFAVALVQKAGGNEDNDEPPTFI